ncbi:Cas10/Cmr2 second palm domain-containing protein [Nocardia salmonicida]|uniref:Cas10/Cmr2 second palm domain-containing protein n=1 Tax=Nocardia salmonicida TaxID=53431 RepID=UPI00378D505E
MVFATNKQRLNVAASRLIWSVGFEWIPQAIASVEHEFDERIDQVVTASGLGTMLASPRAGRRVIEIVTARAVVEAPDLAIWGIVGSEELSEETLGHALGAAQRELGRWRATRPSPLIRDANLPYTQVCAFTGRPAVGVVSEGTAKARTYYPASAGIERLWADSSKARRALVTRLHAAVDTDAERAVIDRAVVSKADLERGDGVANNGWIAVLHADGNGIGDIFTHLRHCFPGQELVHRLGQVSALLERCAWQAVARAIVATDDPGKPGWVLPILVGGDDITVVLNARFAFEYTASLARAFEALVNEEPITDALAWIREYQDDWKVEVTAPQRVTLAAGLVYAKPHHPFSHSVVLADELAGSAKTIKRSEVSAVDVHVLHESAVRELSAIRDGLQVPDEYGATLDLWAGPIVLSDAAPASLAGRHLDHVHEAIALLRVSDPGGEGSGTAIPGGVVHDLREALTSSTHGATVRLTQVGERAKAVAHGRGYAPALDKLLDRHLVCSAAAGGADGGGRFSRLVTAMDLVDVATGTDAGNVDD